MPTTLIKETRIVPRNISYISGMKKARFLLGGQKNRLYTPFKEGLVRNRFSDPNRIWTFRIDTMKFDAFDPVSFDEWIIIEMQTDPATASTSSQVVETEFNLILAYLLGNRKFFIFDD
jgi:hypothetical protein